jgi:hypothetical protein
MDGPCLEFQELSGTQQYSYRRDTVFSQLPISVNARADKGHIHAD